MDVPIYIAGQPDGDGAQRRLRDFVQASGDGWGLRQIIRTLQAFWDGGHQGRGGAEWVEWSPEYAEYARERGRRTILVDTGTLRQSLVHRTDQTPGTVTIWLGSPVPYFADHQYGRGVPQRKVFEVTATDRRDLDNRVREGVRRAMGGL